MNKTSKTIESSKFLALCQIKPSLVNDNLPFIQITFKKKNLCIILTSERHFKVY